MFVAADMADTLLVALVTELRACAPVSKMIVIGPARTAGELRTLNALKLACYVQWDVVNAERVRHIIALVGGADLYIVSGATVDAFMAPERRLQPRDPALVLTPLERVVLRGVAAGMRHAAIADAAHVSVATVERTIAVLWGKFCVSSTCALCARAGHWGFVE
jgi:DNA-binding NarL/FixJ family response regulator